jgi:hypothetical protein
LKKIYTNNTLFFKKLKKKRIKPGLVGPGKPGVTSGLIKQWPSRGPLFLLKSFCPSQIFKKKKNTSPAKPKIWPLRWPKKWDP